MIENIISQIKETEEKAKEILASSKKEYKDIIEEAYKKADKIIKEAEEEVKVMFAEAEDKARNEAAVEAKQMEKDYGKKQEKIENISRVNHEKAIERITRRILD